MSEVHTRTASMHPRHLHPKKVEKRARQVKKCSEIINHYIIGCIGGEEGHCIRIPVLDI